VGARLDILVANAGVGNAAPIESYTVRAPFFLVQQLMPILGEGSSVILLSSLAAHANVGTLSAYAATKGAIDTLVKHFAAAIGERGVPVNAVAPGVVENRHVGLRQDRCGPGGPLGIQALKRIAPPDDIAGAVAFLASDAARWITGDTLRVDGGAKL